MALFSRIGQRLSFIRFVANRPPLTVPDHPELIVPQAVRDRAFPKVGNRDIVGYGSCGYPTYLDTLEIPAPAIRFGVNTPEILALKEKEKQEWSKLSIDEKKQLYRHTFCKTFAEMMAPTGEWRILLAGVLIAFGIVNCLVVFYTNRYWRGWGKEDSLISKTLWDPEVRQMQFRRQILAGHGPIFGASRYYDYDKDEWLDHPKH